MTDQEFADFCADHPELFFEMTSEGEIIVMPPTYTLTGARNSEIIAQLRDWARYDGQGVVTDSSTGFVLANGARRSADAAWTSHSRIRQLAPESLERYWHLCPDFVIELKSKTDRVRTLREKMLEWIVNGAQLGWLIDPETRTVEIYRHSMQPELRSALIVLEGEGPVKGFTLELSKIWDPLTETLHS